MKVRIVILVGIILACASLSIAQKIETKMIPDFTLPDMNGNIVSMSKSLGQGPIYISFWATYCKPCMEELKIIEKYYEKYKNRGFRVFAIDMEGPKTQSKVKSLMISMGFTFDILLDNNGDVFRRKFKGSSCPYSFLVNPDGKIVFSSLGFKPGDEVKIEKLIVENLHPATDSSGQN
jgi:cytochrome c biogenesis protein CcmG/thiol:disulfide interchange protein DsbE